jgi:hypothetical protein
MPPLKTLSRRDRLAIAAAALVASLSVTATVVLAFAGDEAAEWFVGDSALARVAQRCDQPRMSSTERHRCLREVAAAQRATDGTPTRLASRH